MRKFVYDAAQAQSRCRVYEKIADALIQDGLLPSSDVVLRAGRIPLFVDGYFILNHAYKKWRIQEEHLTQHEKIAALTAMAIMTFRPFRPASELASTRAQAKANEIYALTCASSVLGASLRVNVDAESNLMARIIDVVAQGHSQTLESFVQDKNLQISRDVQTYDLEILEADKLVLNSLVSIFELLPKRATPTSTSPTAD